MAYLLEAIIDGTIRGAIYALMALGFVVTYKTTRVANFALGEFIVFGVGFAAFGYHVLGLGLVGSLLVGCALMALLSGAFSRVVLARVAHSSPIALLMLTLGLGAFLQGLGPLVFRGFPLQVPLPLEPKTVTVGGMLVSLDELVIGLVAAVAIAGVSLALARSRAGLALRALAEDPVTALAMGIDSRRYYALAWVLAGCIVVLDGVLWAALTGGGVGFLLVGLKVFPIVIIGGLDSVPGTLVGGVLVGVLDALAATYLDPQVGASVSHISAYAVLVGVLMVRPQGLFGAERVERV